jgi:hypothetical protein
MRIGSYVQKRGSKNTLGIITERPPVSYCWKVLWTRGDQRGRSTLMQEDHLVVVETK